MTALWFPEQVQARIASGWLVGADMHLSWRLACVAAAREHCVPGPFDAELAEA